MFPTNWVWDDDGDRPPIRVPADAALSCAVGCCESFNDPPIRALITQLCRWGCDPNWSVGGMSGISAIDFVEQLDDQGEGTRFISGLLHDHRDNPGFGGPMGDLLERLRMENPSMCNLAIEHLEQLLEPESPNGGPSVLSEDEFAGGGFSPQLKKYVPSMVDHEWGGCNLENPETLVVTSTYDGAFTCVLGTYLLEQGRSPCGRPIYKKPNQPLFIIYASSLRSWVFTESSNSRQTWRARWKVLWRVRSDAMTPLDVTETWAVVRPNFYDSNGCPVVNRQQEVINWWDNVRDIEFSSSLFPGLPDACPCNEKVESDSNITGAAAAVACASTVTEKKTSGSSSGSSSESSSDSDDDE